MQRVIWIDTTGMAMGIGDAIMLLTAVTGLRLQHPTAQIYVTVQAVHFGWVSLFSGFTPLLSPLAPPEKPTATYTLFNVITNEQKDLVKKPRHVYYSQACGNTTAHPPIPHPLPKSEVAAARQYGDATILVPHAHQGSRLWSIPHWFMLAQMLREAGEKPVVVTSNAPMALAIKCPMIVSAKPAKVAAVVAAAKQAICVDTGIAHIASAFGTPTLVINGPGQGDKIYGVYGCAKCIQGHAPCDGCNWAKGRTCYHSSRCETSCASLQTIMPNEVMDAIKTMPRRIDRHAQQLAKKSRQTIPLS